MSPSVISPLTAVKALAFDVFGTTVDWRSSVISELDLRVHRKLNTPGSSPLPASLGARLDYLNANYNTSDDGGTSWTARFADAWRASYWYFVRSQARAGLQDASTLKTTDAHLHDSLVELLDDWQLTDLFSASEIASLSLVWHRLAPWPDAAAGLAQLAAAGALGLQTATLSNGSTALVRDLNDFGDLGFQHLFCAESLRAYKPAPETYLGAADRLGLRPDEVAMVAAHMADLEAARAVGLRTVYVERRGEEEWDAQRLEEAKTWVDVWIKEDEGGFVGLAKRLEELRGL